MAEGLNEYISFWKYDQSSVEDTVVTNFFDSPVDPEVQNFEAYNEAETMPLCGQLRSSYNSNSSTSTYEFNVVKAPLKFQESISERLTVKQRQWIATKFFKLTHYLGHENQ